MNNKLFLRLTIAGGFVIYTIATLLHEIYDWSGRSIAASLFGAVNESVWEHVKIFAIAYIIWGVVELLWVKPPLKNFTVAKAVGLYFLAISIIGFFYLYTMFTKEAILAVDIASSLVFVFLSQYLSYRLTLSKKNTGQYFYTALMLLFLAVIMLFCFTYFPPQSEVFRDPITGMFGVIPEHIDMGAPTLNSLSNIHL